jgi:osmotically-inducible protein OsmY
MMRHKLSLAGLLAASFLLQGCFPLAVTGMGAAAVMAVDRRSTGMYIEDENIEWRVFARVRNDFAGAHVNATSYNRRVLLTGEAPNEEMKRKIEEAVRGLLNVSLVTSNVKARMINNGKFSPSHIKVLTEANVVYLMGLVTPAEADAAVEVARTAQGVSSVVKVFEYIN